MVPFEISRTSVIRTNNILKLSSSHMITQLLNFLQARVREMKKIDYYSSGTITVMLVGVPNVGKSALANSLHKIGRISAAGTSLTAYVYLS